MANIELISVKEAESTLKLGRATLWRWRKKGRLQAVKLGKRVLFRVSDIECLINENLQ